MILHLALVNHHYITANQGTAILIGLIILVIIGVIAGFTAGK